MTSVPPPPLPPPQAFLEAEPVKMVKAPYVSRILAALVDILILLPATLIAVFGALAAGEGFKASGFVLGVVVFIVSIVVALALSFWNTVLRQGKKGKTIGKSALKISLVDADTGQPVGRLKAFLRLALETGITYIPLVGLLLLLVDYLFPLWDKKGQRVVDKVINSRVVKD